MDVWRPLDPRRGSRLAAACWRHGTAPLYRDDERPTEAGALLATEALGRALR